MQVDIEVLRDFQRQDYEPTTAQPRREPFERWKTRGFDGGDVASLFHENTKYTDVEFFRTEPSMIQFTEDESYLYAVANIDPDYRTKEKIDLPEPDDIDVDLTSAVMERESERQFVDQGLSLQQLSTLLQHGCGVSHARALTDEAGNELSDVEKELRTYPSSGGLYPIEPYVAVTTPGEDLERGLYYYVPGEHALRVLREGDEAFGRDVRELYVTPVEKFDATDAAVSIYLTSVSWRCKAKYGPRGYRYALQESGHLAQNLLLAATAMGIDGVPLGGFSEDAVDEFLGVDGTDEKSVYSVTLGFTEGGEDGV